MLRAFRFEHVLNRGINVMSDDNTTLGKLKKAVDDFNQERDWKQYHSPKNLAMSIAIEASELMQLFQWTESSASWSLCREPEILSGIKDEISDIIVYCLDMADAVDFDVSTALMEKMEKNRRNYPIEKARGSSKKYTEL